MQQDDNEDDTQTKEELEENAERMKKYVKCTCCREIGHSMENCQRDPNFKTLANMTTDAGRISKINDFKKLFADTLINTTHFIKKAVMIPVEFDDDGI